MKIKEFNNENFCLDSKTAEILYNDYAANLPIIDYHCHLDPKQIAENKNFKSITEVWLYGDHYKWRAMRTNGIDEKFCTGKNTNDWEKFEKWAETVPATVRNPLYHWTHMELKSAFNITDLLNKESAKEIYHKCNLKLSSTEFKPQDILKHYNVELFCTTDDPIDDLKYHKQLGEENNEIKMFPTWRADKVLVIDDSINFLNYILKLSEVSDIEINSYQTLLQALQKRHDYFSELGCKLSDHGIEEFYADEYTEIEINLIFRKSLQGIQISSKEALKYKSAILHDLAIMDWEKKWTQQFHYGALRNNNARLLTTLGSDTGFDSIGDLAVAQNMSKFFNKLDAKNQLTKTIIYNLNPRDNELVATMIGNFQDGTISGKMQFGSGWWFLDQKEGMEKQINSLSSLGLLSRFIGMLTDSRSLLSYPRHDYFRRILCNLLAEDINKGLIPNDQKLIGGMIEDICYNNAKNFLQLA
ncbi:glucuronate isomerase [Flavicella sp.]|uniref:glucuronate isomerase n=1 Tax=Flavicella sp. TaxID=2957742 RepID=UPI002628ADCD|nr:glucuronate isomerase [Flavicella sp.]MDG1804279.1 glucuronate isomerase [Flavicella sp.]MDG2280888.1 glucuronate isomerase [Flavicella sp.]